MVDDERDGEEDGELKLPVTPTRAPGAVQHEVMHRRPGTHTSPRSWAPDQQCTTAQKRGAALHPGHDAIQATFAPSPVICSSTLPFVSMPTNHSAMAASRKASAKVCST